MTNSRVIASTRVWCSATALGPKWASSAGDSKAVSHSPDRKPWPACRSTVRRLRWHLAKREGGAGQDRAR